MRPSAAEGLPGPGRPPSGPGGPWSGHAFGINLRADFEVAGLTPCEPLEPFERFTAVRLDSEEAIRAAWNGRSPERLVEWRDGSKPQGELDLLPDLGYRLAVDEYGTFTVAPDGGLVRCAPSAGGSGPWEECLLGQVLPLAAVLRGVEVLHASAVSLGGRAAAFVGASTTGKTSLAVNLVASGARLVTDDVLGVAMSDEGFRCFPGAGVVRLRHSEAAAVGEDWRRLGTVSARGPDSVRLIVDRDDRPLPLSAVYFLDRAPRSETAVERVEAIDPRLLLASSFNFVVRDRARLVNQLDVCAALSAEVPQFRLWIGADTPAGALSEAILAQMNELWDGGAA